MGSIGYTYGVTSGMELSPNGSVLALCYSFDDQLGLVDTAAQSEIIRVPVGDFPIRVAFNPNGFVAYVVNSFSDDLSVVRIAGINSYTAATVPGIEFPLPVNVDDTGSFVYVGSFDTINPSIKVVNASLNSIVQTVALSSAPRAAHLSTGTDVLHVATTGGTLARVSATGPASALIDETPLSAGPSDMVFSESRQIAVAAQPIPDGVDRVSYVPLGDLDHDGTVSVTDFLMLLGEWGPCPDPPDPCPADLDGDGMVGITDFLIQLANWG
jgi:DNA-binding beta-propeller fold protein YncE